MPPDTTTIDIQVGGVRETPRRVRFARRDAENHVTASLSITAPSGEELELLALRRSRVIGSATVDDVTFLGPHAFSEAAPGRLDPEATKRARLIERQAAGTVGYAAYCLGSGRRAVANGRRRVTAASTLKLAILLDVLAKRRRDPVTDTFSPTYSQLVVQSSNEAANELLAWLGHGSITDGAAKVNRFMKRLGMTASYLDGAYRLGGGPSLKRTSASDLAMLGTDLLLAAEDRGPLIRIGLNRHEARVAIGLMTMEDYPGLVRDNVDAPVAHKAGWLTNVENDVALVFYPRQGGPCVEAIVTEGLSFASADALGRRFATGVLDRLSEGSQR